MERLTLLLIATVLCACTVPFGPGSSSSATPGSPTTIRHEPGGPRGASGGGPN